MRYPPNLQFHDVNSGGDWITAVDKPDLPDNYIMEGRGVRNILEGVLAERDYGTQHRYATYVTKPSAITMVDGITIFDNATSKEYDIVAGYDTSNYFHVYVNITDDTTVIANNIGVANNWLELTRVFTCEVNGTPVDPAAIVTIDNIKDSLQAVYAPATNEFRYYIAWNVDRNNFAFILASDATTISSDTRFSSSGLAWVDNDNVILFRDSGWMDEFFVAAPTNPPTAASINASLGTTPHTRWSLVEAQNKVNGYWGTSASPPVMLSSKRMRRYNASRPFFYINSSSALINLPANWFMEKGGGGLCTYYSTKGTALSPIVGNPTTGTASIEDKSGNVFMKVNYSLNAISVIGNTTPGLRVAMTLVYDGYQESDPVYRWYFQTSNDNLAKLDLSATGGIEISLARMNKSITAIRFYTAGATQTQISAGWKESDADYTLSLELPLNAGTFTFEGATLNYGAGTILWQTNSVSEYTYRANNVLGYSIIYRAGIPSTVLSSTLGHASDTTRTYLLPRYPVRMAQSQGALSIVDQDDATSRISTFDGNGANNDDNFPDLTADNLGNKLKILWNGRDEMMGQAVQREMVYAFRRAEYETYDLQSAIQRKSPCDFLAKRSLLSTPYGLFWAGNFNIWWLPESGGEPIPISRNFENWYNGTLKIDYGSGTSSYVDQSYRSSIFSGFDQTFQEVYFYTQVNKDTEFGGSSEYVALRFAPKTGKWLVPRHFNIASQARWFMSRLTDTNGSLFSLGYSTGVLRYPTKAGISAVLRTYYDDVSSAETGGNAIVTRLTLNMGSLYGIIKKSALYNCYVDQIADTSQDANAVFNIDFFANNETTAYETKNQIASTRSIPRQLPPRGQLERLRVRLSLASNTLIKRWEVSKLTVGAVPLNRIGNR